jgi:uncharacterized protein
VSQRFQVTLRFHEALRLFLAPRSRSGEVATGYDGTSSLGHVIESLGVPLTEVGPLRIGTAPASPPDRIPPGEPVTVLPVPRPQRAPTDPPRFCLDVHLGTLARRLRLLGLDTSYRNDADDDELIEEAAAQRRVLLTQDRWLLRRRAVAAGAYVRGSRPDDQLADLLDRFAPPLAPWSRCGECNGLLAPVSKPDVEHLLEPGTRRTYEVFARCQSCGRVYWRGAHTPKLAAVIDTAREIVAARAALSAPPG